MKTKYLDFSYWACIVLKALDCITTFFALTAIEGPVEKNPIVRYFMTELGLLNCLVLLYIWCLLLFTFLADKCHETKNNWAMHLLVVLHVVVVANNFIVIAKGLLP